MSLFDYIKAHDHEAVSLLLQNKSYTPSFEEKKTAALEAMQANDEVMLSLLLNDEQKRFETGTEESPILFILCLLGQNHLLKVLLADHRVDPGANSNAAIRSAPMTGNEETVSLLLAHPRVNPSAEDNEAMNNAITHNHPKIVRLLLPHLKQAGIPWTAFFDMSLDDHQLLENVKAFMEDNEDYIRHNVLKIQSAAFELLLLQEDIRELEIKQIAALADDEESAMSDSKVDKALQFSEIVQAHFKHVFDQFGDNDPNRVLAIEKLIRKMILDDICSEPMSNEQKNFIEQHRDTLIAASDESIMALAREQYFNTHSANHAAWRGYDAKAPYQGYHKNLLTTQTEDVALFSNSESNNITSVEASNKIRKMMAYYYLLVIDQNEPEMLSFRKANFISELADLRLTHQEECDGNDAPSCYPGYLGRTLNLAFGHSLSKHLVTPKTVIMEYLSPIILENFKDALKQCASAEGCEQLLQSISWLTTTQTRAIVLKQSEYPENLLLIRNEFIKTLYERKKSFYQEIDQLLKEKGLAPLDEVGRKFVRLCLMDPAYGFNFGRLGRTYSNYVQENYPPSPAELPLDSNIEIFNPFKIQYRAAKRLIKSNNERISTLKQKSKLFAKLEQDINEKAKKLLPHNESHFDQSGLILLLKVAITEMPLSSIETPALFNDAFEQTLTEHANSDAAYPQALHLLQLFKNRMEKVLTPKKAAVNTNKMADSTEVAIKQNAIRELS